MTYDCKDYSSSSLLPAAFVGAFFCGSLVVARCFRRPYTRYQVSELVWLPPCASSSRQTRHRGVGGQLGHLDVLDVRIAILLIVGTTGETKRDRWDWGE